MMSTFKNLEALIDQADQDYEMSMDDRYSERTQDQAYEAFHDGMKEITKMLGILTNGKIGYKTAMRMAMNKRGEIMELIARAK